MPTSTSNRTWLFVFVIISGLVCYGILGPFQVPEIIPYGDKLQHVVAFALVAITGRLALRTSPPLLLWLGLLLIGLNLEWIQHYLSPGRQFSLWDSAANVAGIAVALAGTSLYERAAPALRLTSTGRSGR